mgnify:CR=1 FL=1
MADTTEPTNEALITWLRGGTGDPSYELSQIADRFSAVLAECGIWQNAAGRNAVRAEQADDRLEASEARVRELEAELARTREALTWAMDEIDELANVACGFAYPQAMTIIGRKSQSDSYFAACTARRAAPPKPEPADG